MDHLPIRLIVIISNLHDAKLIGPQKVGFSFAQHMSDLGVKTLVITNSINEKNPILKQSSENLQMFILPGEAKSSTYLMNIGLIIKEASKFHPSVIHGHGFSSVMLAVLLGKILNVPNVQTIYDLPLFSTMPKRLQLFSLLFSNYIICTSKYTQNYLAKVDLSSKRMIVQDYGLEEVWFNLAKSVKPILANKKTEVLFFGDANSERGVDLLLGAASKIAGRHSTVHFTFAIRRWESHALKKIESFASTYPVSLVLNDKAHISTVVSSADIVILPYILTTMQPPLTLVESMLLGKVVITTDVEANREFIGENERGLLVKPNVESLVQALEFALTNPQKARSMGSSAMHFIQKTYDWKVAEARVIKVYEQFLR